MTDSPTQPAKPTWIGTLLRPKVAFPLTGLILLLLSPLLIRGWNLSQIPDVDEPTMPSTENSPTTSKSSEAVKHFRAAIEHFVGPPYLLGAVFPEQLVGDRPAKNLYGFRESSTKPLLPLRWEDAGTERILSRAQLISYIDSNAESSNEFREATKTLHAPTQVLLTYLNECDQHILNAICALGVIRADRELAEERLDRAWDDLYAVYCFRIFVTGHTETYLSHGPYFSSYTMIDCLDRLASSPLMTPELFRRMTTDLEHATALLPNLDWYIDNSYERTRLEIVRLHKLMGARSELGEAGSIIETGSSVKRKSSAQIYMLGEPDISLRLLKQHYLWLRYWFHAGGKYSGGKFGGGVTSITPYLHDPRMGSIAAPAEWMTPKELAAAMRSKGVYLNELVLEFPDWAARSASEQAGHQLVRIYVARRWFQYDNGRPAETLEELVPKYLAEIPVDPTSADQSPMTLNPTQWPDGKLEAKLVIAWRNIQTRIYQVLRPAQQGVF